MNNKNRKIGLYNISSVFSTKQKIGDDNENANKQKE